MARGAALLLFLALVSAIAQAEAIEGTVVAIADGDTLTLLVAKKQQVWIRLAEIDTPERGHPYAKRTWRSCGGATNFIVPLEVSGHRAPRFEVV